MNDQRGQQTDRFDACLCCGGTPVSSASGLCPRCDDGGDDFDEDAHFCHRCHNEGTIIVCCDDMCRGAGECMHGDGEIVCPDCKGRNL